MALAVIVLSFIAVWIGQGQSQCTLQQLETNLGPTDGEAATGIVSEALDAANSQASAPLVQILSFQIVCLSSDEQRETYRGVSVVVNYTCTGSNTECGTGFVVSQFDLMCGSNNQWSSTVFGSGINTITTPSDGTLTTPRLTNCSICISPTRESLSDQTTHCLPCHSNCNVGLMLCTGTGMSDCCSYYDDDTCVSQCPAPRRPLNDNTCSVFCDPLAQPENGMPIVLTDDNNEGSVATYSCNAGYNLVGSQNRTCVVSSNQMDTMWTDSEPMCQIVDCGNLTDPVNGNIVFNGGTVLNATATYTCDDTSELTPSGGTTRTCQASGEWTGIAAICKCKSGYKEGDDSGVCEKSGLSPGGIAGIVVGVILFIIILLVIIVLVAFAITRNSCNSNSVKDEN